MFQSLCVSCSRYFYIDFPDSVNTEPVWLSTGLHWHSGFHVQDISSLISKTLLAQGLIKHPSEHVDSRIICTQATSSSNPLTSLIQRSLGSHDNVSGCEMYAIMPCNAFTTLLLSTTQSPMIDNSFVWWSRNDLYSRAQ
jgi:hypothetical protein